MAGKNNQKTDVAQIFDLRKSETEEDAKEMLHHLETLKDPCCSKKDEEHHIQIFVNKCGMAPICIQQQPSTTIFALKALLQDKLGIQPEKQQLSTLKGIVLCDDLSLEEQHIEQDANLELSIGPGLLGGRKRGNRGNQLKDNQKNQSENRQRDPTPASSGGGFRKLMLWLIGIFISPVWRLFRREQPVKSAAVKSAAVKSAAVKSAAVKSAAVKRKKQPEPNVVNIDAVKSPVFVGSLTEGNKFIYSSPGPSGTPNRNRPMAPSRETTSQVNQSERRQNDAAAEDVLNITSFKGPVILGTAKNNTFKYN